VGGGGFADIYKGTYQGSTVALKVLRVYAPEKVRRKLQMDFLREALIWRQLQHQNIAPFLGVDMYTHQPHMSMVSPWMVNGNIMEYLEKNPGADRVKLLHGVAQGLDYLHSMRPKIIHGDIRGANILIDGCQYPVLIDFGLAIVADSQSAATGTTSRSGQGGSTRWMAPELFNPSMFKMDTYQRTPASDVYAFGCLALEIYTGKAPFQGCNDAAVIFQVIDGKRPTYPTDGIPIPWRVRNLIEMCWTPNPADRPETSKLIPPFELERRLLPLTLFEVSTASVSNTAWNPIDSNLLATLFVLVASALVVSLNSMVLRIQYHS